ncbi:hypothetical protein METHPM2_1420013 [Pseudomonas sp. PM2]
MECVTVLYLPSCYASHTAIL